jgi:hypothetical protein
MFLHTLHVVLCYLGMFSVTDEGDERFAGTRVSDVQGPPVIFQTSVTVPIDIKCPEQHQDIDEIAMSSSKRRITLVDDCMNRVRSAS